MSISSAGKKDDEKKYFYNVSDCQHCTSRTNTDKLAVQLGSKVIKYDCVKHLVGKGKTHNSHKKEKD